MRGFVYNGLPARVLFGEGSLARLGEEIGRLGLRRVLLLSTPQQGGSVAEIARALRDRAAGVFTEATMHTPVAVTERALAAVAAAGADGVVAVGGGSTTGLGKAIALRTGLPQIVVPTTYAGSEMTPILGETEGGVKTTLRNLAVLPRTVIYDVDLTLGLPPALSAVSGLNAMAHAVEALYAEDRNPIVDIMAAEAIRALAGALPVIVERPSDRAMRADALYGAWLAGICLGSVGMALHHKLCHTLGGAFDLPHAETHAVVLPHAVAYNAAAAPDAMAAVAGALGAEDAAAGLAALARRVGAPTSLRELGMPEAGVEHAVELALANPYGNPRPLTAAGLRALIAAAWAGAAPGGDPGQKGARR